MSALTAIQKAEQAIRNFVSDAVFTDTANAEMRKEGYGGRSLDGGKLNDLMDDLRLAAQAGAAAAPRELHIDWQALWATFDEFCDQDGYVDWWGPNGQQQKIQALVETALREASGLVPPQPEATDQP